MLGFEHFESLEALRDLGALQAELGRNAEAAAPCCEATFFGDFVQVILKLFFVNPRNGRNTKNNGENVRRLHIQYYI